MDEVRHGILYAWKGAKKGLKLTQSALRSIPVDRLRMPNSSSVTSKSGALRRLFQRKYGAEIENGDGNRVAASEMSDVESEEEDPLTDQQLHEHVGKKYFDKSYEAMRYEITHIGIADGDGSDEARQRQATEVAIRELRLKCNIVNATLKKRVLANSKGFVNGVEEIRLINDSLLETSSDCKKGRNIIRRAKNAAAEQIKILAYQRRRKNCGTTLLLLDAMRELCWKQNRLAALIKGGKLLEAVELLHQHADIAQEERIKKVYCMRRIIEEWKKYRDNKEVLQCCQEMLLVESLTTKFVLSNYLNAFEASHAVGTADRICAFIGQTLWQTAVCILTRSLIEVSTIKEEDVSIADIAAAIHPDHLMLCLCQMSAKLMDFFFCFAIIRKVHDDNSHTNEPLAMLHATALKEIDILGVKLGQDLVEKVFLVLDKSRFDSVNLEQVLHVFFVISMFVEALPMLGLGEADKSAALAQIKTVLARYIERQFQQPKASQMLRFMTEDTWEVSEISALELQIVTSLSSETYNSMANEVRSYLSETSIKAPGIYENPFYAGHMLTVQDTTRMVRTESFCDKFACCGVLQSSLLLTSSAVAVANTLLEYVARIVARYAPLAAETLGWMEDLICLYVYTISTNFVSILRSVSLENQGSLSASTQRVIVEMRAAAERAVGQAGVSAAIAGGNVGAAASGAVDAVGDEILASFPPRIWDRVRSSFVSHAHQYAMVNRVVAVQSCVTLACLLEATIRSLAQLVPQTLLEQRLSRCSAIRLASEELLHLCFHRLCQATFQMESTIQSISKLRASEKGVKTNAYTFQLVEEMALLNKKRLIMPTTELEQLFLKRFIFAVQTMLLKEYSKLAKKGLSDALIMQILVDVQNFQEQVGVAFGKTMLVLPDHVLAMVKAGFIEGKDERFKWVEMHHAAYCAVDILQWFSVGDRATKVQLESLLDQVGHIDTIPITAFR